MDAKILSVSDEMINERIDAFVCSQCELSRARVQALIKAGDILVNDERIRCSYRLKSDDVISVSLPQDCELKVEAENIPLDIIYEDHDVIVVNKPRGMVVHPASGNTSGTLVNALLYHCDDLSGINGVLRPGIVHRIDKDTSGLLIVAKNDQAHTSLSKQLENKTVSRKYYALVHGVIAHETGTIDAPIGRDIKDRKKMAVTSVHSKKAVTHFRVLERFNEYTLVECSLETGRTHQIRVHMAYIKHPVVGDETYGLRKTMHVNGQLLHAHEIRFIHPKTGKEMCFEADIPPVFKEVLADLRKE